MSKTTRDLQNIRDAFDATEQRISGAKSMEEFLVARLRLNQLHELWEQCFEEQRGQLLAQQVAALLCGIVEEVAAIQPPDFGDIE